MLHWSVTVLTASAETSASYEMQNAFVDVSGVIVAVKLLTILDQFYSSVVVKFYSVSFITCQLFWQLVVEELWLLQ